MTKLYIIDECMLRSLVFKAIQLEALSNGGVDNWQGYEQALDNFSKTYGDNDRVIDADLRKYDTENLSLRCSLADEFIKQSYIDEKETK